MLNSEAPWWTQLNRLLRGHKSLPISSFSGTVTSGILESRSAANSFEVQIDLVVVVLISYILSL